LAPEDPYADPSEVATVSASAPPAAPVIAGENGIRVASAPSTPTTEAAPADPYGDPAIAAFFEAVGPVPTKTEPDSKTPATTKAPPASNASTTDGAALGALLTGSPAPGSTTGATSSGPTTATIKRAEIDAALGDFAGTASTFRATFVAQGLRFDDVVAGSLLAKAGLQKGDVVTTIDGQALRSLDDAANLYARLPTARGSTIQVLRAGKPITLRIAIQ
jgi:membrane-associated protease RseP (regulator of RpoE activity)